jgi:hypothetical protein
MPVYHTNKPNQAANLGRIALVSNTFIGNFPKMLRKNNFRACPDCLGTEYYFPQT